jgi:hypothetical protein
MGGVDAVPIPLHGRAYSLTLTLPPLSMLLLKREAPAEIGEIEEIQEIEEEAESVEIEAEELDEAPGLILR